MGEMERRAAAIQHRLLRAEVAPPDNVLDLPDAPEARGSVIVGEAGRAGQVPA